MSWSDYHRKAELAASEAEVRARRGDRDGSVRFYKRAAAAEEKALDELDLTKQRTLGITVVSAAALWYKAREYARAEAIAARWLAYPNLPAFAREELRTILQYAWTDIAQARSDVAFLPDDVIVGVKGGQVVYGGAPLDLVVEKVREVQSMYQRTAEMIARIPLRRRGEPNADIQALCRPWLFQVPPGSYQFAIRIQEPAQTTLFEDARPKAEAVARTFLDIVRAAASSDPGTALPDVVPDAEYRAAFLRLTRNLAPSGDRYGQLEIRSATTPSGQSIVLVPGHRDAINGALRKGNPRPSKKAEEKTRRIVGVLRALHLDNDWLEVAEGDTNGRHMRIEKAGEALDDVVGPMVNKRVIVDVVESKPNHFDFIDIQLYE